MFYLYMFKKDGRFSFKKHKSKKENTSNSTLKTSGGNERALTPDDHILAHGLLYFCLCDWT